MKTYIVRYAIDGDFECTAESPEEAQTMFDNMSLLELAENGELIADDPKTPEEIKLEIAEAREGIPVN